MVLKPNLILDILCKTNKILGGDINKNFEKSQKKTNRTIRKNILNILIKELRE